MPRPSATIESSCTKGSNSSPAAAGEVPLLDDAKPRDGGANQILEEERGDGLEGGEERAPKDVMAARRRRDATETATDWGFHDVR